MCTGILIATAAMSAASAVSEGMEQNRASKFNRRVLGAQAKQAERAGEFQSKQIQKRGREIAGSQRVAFAGAGFDVGQGTAAQVQQETLEAAGEDASQARTNALLEAWGYRAQGTIERNRGKAAQTQGFIKGGASLLGGFNQAGAFG